MAIVRLRAGHVQPVWAGHPWVFAQAVAKVEGAPGPGDVVDVVDPEGNHLGRGYYSPDSAIPVRLLAREADDPLDGASLARRIAAAARWRREVLGLPSAETSGFRLVHAEGDDLPGLVVDVFGEVAAVQLLTHGMKRRQEAIFQAVEEAAGVRSVLEAASPAVQKLEGLAVESGLRRGDAVEALSFTERGLAFEVPLAVAQKTGFYFDQRDNRARVEALAAGRRVLDLHCYLGAFALAAARGGAAEVLAVDSSAPALETAAEVAAANGLAERLRFERGEAGRTLRRLGEEKDRFGLIVLDPPKLVPTRRHLDKGRRAYRRLNAAALRLLEPGGLLLSCSCSAALKPADFLRTLALAAGDAGRRTAVLHWGQQGADHPYPAAFPEGLYLKCAVLRVA